LIAATAIALSRHWIAGEFTVRPAYIDEVLTPNGGQRRSSEGAFLGLLRAISLVGAAAISFGLICDPRYRDFPIQIYLVPAIGFAAEAWLQPRWATGEGGPVETVLCWLVIIQAVVLIALEGASNIQATGWALVLILLGIRILAAGRS
jgi:glucan 1,3-beta-glucosidase